MFLVEPMSLEYAHLISKWVYSDEYSIYSFNNNDETIGELMNGQHWNACYKYCILKVYLSKIIRIS